MLEKVADWIGRKVVISQGLVDDIGKEGVILAIDDDPIQINAWIKVDARRWPPVYLSAPLWWVKDIETGQWAPPGSGGNKVRDIGPTEFYKPTSLAQFENCTGEHSGIHVRKISEDQRRTMPTTMDTY